MESKSNEAKNQNTELMLTTQTDKRTEKQKKKRETKKVRKKKKQEEESFIKGQSKIIRTQSGGFSLAVRDNEQTACQNSQTLGF